MEMTCKQARQERITKEFNPPFIKNHVSITYDYSRYFKNCKPLFFTGYAA